MAKELAPQSASMAGLMIPTVKGELRAFDESDIVGSSHSIVTTIDMSTTAGKKAIYMAKRGTCLPGKDFVNREMKIAHFVMHRAEGTDEQSGEHNVWVRTVLILEDGSYVEFGSKGIVAAIADLCQFYKSPPWSPALHVRLKSVSVGANKNWYVLEPVD